MKNINSIVLGMGCFWGAEKRMSAIRGVIFVESGYANGSYENVSYNAILEHEKHYQAKLTANKNYAEVVKIFYNPLNICLEEILIEFWQNHNPTQNNQQGNDIGTNYRSGIYCNNEQELAIATQTMQNYQKNLNNANFGIIQTEIELLQSYFTAEEYHQQYLLKNPAGYCGLGGTGIDYSKPIKTDIAANVIAADELLIYISSSLEETAIDKDRQNFDSKIFAKWKHQVPMLKISLSKAESIIVNNIKLRSALTNGCVLYIKNKLELQRFTSLSNIADFYKWFGKLILSQDEQLIAFNHGTERAFTGCLLEEKRVGLFVDPLSFEPLFKSTTKFESHSGWPSFYEALYGTIDYHKDQSYGMTRVEVRSKSTGIHLGHVFNDGPKPTGNRYCINSAVLRFIPTG